MSERPAAAARRFEPRLEATNTAELSLGGEGCVAEEARKESVRQEQATPPSRVCVCVWSARVWSSCDRRTPNAFGASGAEDYWPKVS